jgi:hypothetical protein
MKIGTKSLLFGVHQFLWHPWCVGRAWRMIYHRWPTRREWLAIFVHDWGYWGCSDMNGECGIEHPALGARIVSRFISRRVNHPVVANIVRRNWFEFVAGHSANYAKKHGLKLSPLYLADKVSVLMEPMWFYLLRARLSGEGWEYEQHSPKKGQGLRAWLRWYRMRTRAKLAFKR